MNTTQHIQHQVETQVAIDRRRESDKATPANAARATGWKGAIDALERNDPDAAFRLLQSQGSSPEVVNLRAVCLMRMGNAEAALALMRSIALQPGCTWMRSPLPNAFKINFATALLMNGLPNGCADALDEIDDEALPAVQNLRAVLAEWSKSLPFIQRMQWRLGRVAPTKCQISLPFLPGAWELT